MNLKELRKVNKSFEPQQSDIDWTEDMLTGMANVMKNPDALDWVTSYYSFQIRPKDKLALFQEIDFNPTSVVALSNTIKVLEKMGYTIKQDIPFYLNIPATAVPKNFQKKLKKWFNSVLPKDKSSVITNEDPKMRVIGGHTISRDETSEEALDGKTKFTTTNESNKTTIH